MSEQGDALAGAEPVVTKRHGRVALVCLNREQARNAIDGPTTVALDAIFDQLASDAETSAVVLTGRGEKAFCAGMDLKAFASGQAADIMSSKNGFAGLARRDFPKPLIAAVNGAALAGGLEIVLSCDLVVAAAHAVFGIPEVKRGLVAAGGGLIRLARRIPYSVALELALTGDPIGAERAAALGLVNEVVDAAEVVPAAIALAEKICANAPLAVRTSKKIMHQSLDMSEADAWAFSAKAAAPVFTSADALEGAAAFAERRQPNWQRA
ncbi:MAG: crotonase/enoyl-CoA hydratase family protein [Acidimicrobiales bacterium]